MFDISFGEILLICVVALVVLGPERLPVVARTLGALVARAQRFIASVKADIGQHTELANLSALKQEVQQTAAAFQAQLSVEVDEVRQTIHQVQDEAVEAIEAARAPIAEPPAATQLAQADAALDTVAPEPLPMTSPAKLASTQLAPAVQPVVPVVNENQLDLFADASVSPTSHESSR